MGYTLIQHLSYTLWANERTVEILKPLDDELMHREVASSFPSISKTLVHMRDAEVIWLARLKGESLTRWPSGANGEGKQALLTSFIQSSRNVLEFVESKGLGYPSVKIKYKTLKGEEFENTAEELLMHLVNHGSYHRGQLITILRQLGVTRLASTDLIHYLRANKK